MVKRPSHLQAVTSLGGPLPHSAPDQIARPKRVDSQPARIRGELPEMIDVINKSVDAINHMVDQLSVVAATHALPDRVAALESQVAAISEVGRRRDATPEERARWADYLVSLGARHREDSVTAFQARCVHDAWAKALEIEPNVMYPTAGTTEDGDLYLAWNPPGRTLTLEVHRDGIDWFYEDLATTDRDGSEYAESAPPARFFTYLRSFTRR